MLFSRGAVTLVTKVARWYLIVGAGRSHRYNPVGHWIASWRQGEQIYRAIILARLGKTGEDLQERTVPQAFGPLRSTLVRKVRHRIENAKKSRRASKLQKPPHVVCTARRISED